MPRSKPVTTKDSSAPKKKKQKTPLGEKTFAKSKPASAVSGGGVVRKPHRWRPGTAALREIRRMQKSTELLSRRAPVVRLIRELLQELRQDTHNEDFRLNRAAVEALRTGLEHAVTQNFEYAMLLAIHGKRKTLRPNDMRLARESKNFALGW